jgi:hypothetical protein
LLHSLGSFLRARFPPAQIRAAARPEEQSHPSLVAMRADPAATLTLAGLPPDPWQQQILRTKATRILLCCCRQSGKSTTAAALALCTAMLEPGSLILLLSPTLRQSGELYRKLVSQYRAIGSPVATERETALTIEFVNGSRVVSLPENEASVRGYSGVRLLVIDEASRVADDLYKAIRPMLAVSRGRLVALSTPFGKRGWYWDEFRSTNKWERVRVTAAQCPRISAEFLAEEKKALGEHWYNQEYNVSFEEAIDSVFRQSDIEAAFADDDVKPMEFEEAEQ